MVLFIFFYTIFFLFCLFVCLFVYTSVQMYIFVYKQPISWGIWERVSIPRLCSLIWERDWGNVCGSCKDGGSLWSWFLSGPSTTSWLESSALPDTRLNWTTSKRGESGWYRVPYTKVSIQQWQGVTQCELLCVVSSNASVVLWLRSFSELTTEL